MRLSEQVWGDAERRVLLVHGLFSDRRCWWRLGPDLARRGYVVHAPDLRGHGRTGPANRYSPTDWGLDLVETYREFSFDLALGHSLGGIALAVAEAGLNAASSVYLDPAWLMTDEQSARFHAQFIAALDWTDPEQERSALGPSWPDEDLRLAWDALRHTDPAVVPGLARGHGFDHSPETVAHATLVLGADPSEYITPDVIPELRRRGLVVESPPGTGHAWFRDNYSAFLTRIERWLDEHPTTADDTRRGSWTSASDAV